MGKQVGKKFAWVIENFSSLQYIGSNIHSFGDLYAYPKGDNVDYLSVYLEVVDWKSLPSGWRRYVKLRLTVVKQTWDIDSVMKETHSWFDAKFPGWGFPMIPLTKLHDEREGFLEDGDLVVAAEVDVLEVIGTLDEPEESKEASSLLKNISGNDDGAENMNVNGFQVLPSQIESVRRIFERHPDTAVGFRAKNQHLRKACLNVLLSVIETLCQSLEELSNDDIVEADIALTYLKDAGFKVIWLERKLDLVKEKKEREHSSLVRLQEMDDSLLKLKLKVEKEEAELSATRTPLSFDDVV